MHFSHAVVDGSNIATESRSLPSLAQLDEAVRDFQSEFSGVEIIVVVDASFGHRIDESERLLFEEAEAAGEVVSPPAGAIGRGDAFLLRIAERTGATVLSNDSFQEFHGEHEWLFEEDRLIGGKPIPNVGWIFTARTPVRGPRSREAVREARRAQVRIGSKEASLPMPVPKAPPPRRSAVETSASVVQANDQAADSLPNPAGRLRPVARQNVARTSAQGAHQSTVSEAIDDATEEVVAPESPAARQRRRSAPPSHAVNDPLTFIRFIAEHPLGATVEGEVESFTSHGAFITIGDAKGYVPLSGLGDPPPRRARDVLVKGQPRVFELQALDAQRRGIELALPEFAHVSGQPSEETVEAEIEDSAPKEPPRPRRRKVVAPKAGAIAADSTTIEVAPSIEVAQDGVQNQAPDGTDARDSNALESTEAAAVIEAQTKTVIPQRSRRRAPKSVLAEPQLQVELASPEDQLEKPVPKARPVRRKRLAKTPVGEMLSGESVDSVPSAEPVVDGPASDPLSSKGKEELKPSVDIEGAAKPRVRRARKPATALAAQSLDPQPQTQSEDVESDLGARPQGAPVATAAKQRRAPRRKVEQNSAVPETAAPETAVPETAADPGKPVPRRRAARKPETPKPEALKPEALKPEALKPATRRPAVRKPAVRKPAVRKPAKSKVTQEGEHEMEQ